MRLIAMVPARAGSTRLKLKNLALLDGRPLIAYAIEAALESGVFDRVVVNSDHEIFGEIAARYGAQFYLRPPEHGSSLTASDDVVYDFIKHNPCDVVAWVNPIAPLQTPAEVRDVVEAFLERKLDSMVTTLSQQVHCVSRGAPVNFLVDGPFARTQDLTPVELFVYSIMMWRTGTFVEAFQKQGYALLSGKVGYIPVSKSSALIVKTEEDLRLADAILKGMRAQRELQYDEAAERIAQVRSIS